MAERGEALMRIIVGIVSGIVLGLWGALIRIVVMINFLVTLIINKRNKDLAVFCELWNSQLYSFLRYMTFVSNKRPFPFNSLNKNISKFEK